MILQYSEFKNSGGTFYRPTPDSLWLKTTVEFAGLSTCQRKQVGCFILSPDLGEVLAYGYNGNYRGGPNGCDFPDNRRGCGCIHAENNALIKHRGDVGGATVFVSTSPCLACAKLILNAGIGRCVYYKAFSDASGIELLSKRIEVMQIGGED